MVASLASTMSAKEGELHAAMGAAQATAAQAARVKREAEEAVKHAYEDARLGHSERAAARLMASGRGASLLGPAAGYTPGLIAARTPPETSTALATATKLAAAREAMARRASQSPRAPATPATRG